jgi:hypothetical protein
MNLHQRAARRTLWRRFGEFGSPPECATNCEAGAFLPHPASHPQSARVVGLEGQLVCRSHRSVLHKHEQFRFPTPTLRLWSLLSPEQKLDTGEIWPEKRRADRGGSRESR